MSKKPQPSVPRSARSALLSLLFLTACNLSLPDEYHVDDLRVLDLRVDPPEISLFARDVGHPLELDVENLPPILNQEVTVHALVAHPDLDARFTFEWLRCRPGLERIPCDPGSDERIAAGQSSILRFSPNALILADVVGGARLEDVAASMFEDPRDLLNGLFAFVNLRLNVTNASITVDTSSLFATKRIVIFEPRLVAWAIREFSSTSAAALPDIEGLPRLCFDSGAATMNRIRSFLSTRRPNRAPRHRGVRVTQRVAADASGTTITTTLTHGQSLHIEPGASLTLSAVTTATDAESYALIDANCGILDRTERIAISWFTQRGELSRQLTTHESPNTNYTAPGGLEGRAEMRDTVGDGRVRIWSVVRDGRGGSDHMFVDFQIQ